MVAQSEQAFLAIRQGATPQEAAVKILEYKEMEPFFVKGERGEPWQQQAAAPAVFEI